MVGVKEKQKSRIRKGSAGEMPPGGVCGKLG